MQIRSAAPIHNDGTELHELTNRGARLVERRSPGALSHHRAFYSSVLANENPQIRLSTDPGME